MRLLIESVIFLLIFYTNADVSFENFKKKHGKWYATKEENALRLKLFKEASKSIDDHNKNAERGEHSFKMGLNLFSDWTDEEKSKFLSLKTSPKRPTNEVRFELQLVKATTTDKVPETVDWRTRGYVTGVKNQGKCGSCWAFAAAAAIESAHFKINGELIDLSAQQLLDCENFFSLGCDGGSSETAFDYVIENGGIQTWSSYPYEEAEFVCRNDSTGNAAFLSTYQYVESNEETLKIALATEGPIITYLNGSPIMSYSSGIFNSNCSRVMNHAGLLVGYGTDKNTDYWLMKNSWGRDWGDHGYIKIARNRGFLCGVGLITVFPVASSIRFKQSSEPSSSGANRAI